MCAATLCCGVLFAQTDEQKIGESIDCIQLIQDKYSKGWNRIVVRPANSPEILCGTKSDGNSPKEFNKKIFPSQLLSMGELSAVGKESHVLMQNVRSVGAFEKNETITRVQFQISLTDSPQSAQYNSMVLLKNPMVFARPSVFVMPQEHLVTIGRGTSSGQGKEWTMFAMDKEFPGATMTHLKKNCECFWMFCESIPNHGNFSIKNLHIGIRGESDRDVNNNDEKRQFAVAIRPRVGMTLLLLPTVLRLFLTMLPPILKRHPNRN